MSDRSRLPPEPSLCPSTRDEKDGESAHDREDEDHPSKREPEHE